MAQDKDLTWNELANDYDSCHSGFKARTLPMKDIFEWAEKQEKRYKVTKTGTLRYVKEGE